MGVNAKDQVPVALPPGKEALYSSNRRNVDPRAGLTFWGTEKSLVHVRIENLDRPTRSLVTLLTTIPPAPMYERLKI